ncbi:NmrA family NAD(P)-binding protein [Spirillospora sp. NPDC000708]
MLLVTGPSGNVGSELVDLLVEQGAGRPWRVASRHPEALAGRVAEAGGEAARLDFFDRATWPAALDGIDTLFLLFPLPGNKAARNGIIPFLEAVEHAGCRHAVYVSVFGADRARFIPHYKVEQRLFSSGMTWTVLRCSFFMQNLHRSISTHGEDIVDHHELFIPAGRGRTTFIDARDAAAVAAAALLDPPAHHNAVHHLTGSQALSMDEVAAALSVRLGYPVHYSRPSLPRFATRLRRRGVGWDSIGFMSAVYTLTRLGRNQPITGDVEHLLGRPPRTLDEFLEFSMWRWRERAWT